MKKIYEAPTVDKIAFNYRDQVVAASGVEGGSNTSANTGSGNAANDFVDRLFQNAGWSGCDVVGDIIGGIFG